MAAKPPRQLSWIQLVPIIRADLQVGHEEEAIALLLHFARSFIGSVPTDQAKLIAEAPATTGDQRFAAAVAGLVEFACVESGLEMPKWVNDPHRFVESWQLGIADESLMGHTPPPIARHGVFITRKYLENI